MKNNNDEFCCVFIIITVRGNSVGDYYAIGSDCWDYKGIIITLITCIIYNIHYIFC